ncbi:putative Ig domain-containing protein [Mycobacterium sp. BK086]|uniref:putative Ig domain-containing protein n=1 Tax=Mycobacterium sp. BK086 TaxID=2512165 RepID=UPI00105C30F0|nr:putative Ig domain-containing protein [Mycobacterium sp. BK086]TDO18119.1 putative Ig domain-containing protein [Mycobacterium sp. BK086]
MTLGEFHISGGASQRVASGAGPQDSESLVGLRGKFVSNIPAGQPVPVDGGVEYVPERRFVVGDDGLLYEILLDEHNEESVSDTPGVTLTAADDMFDDTLQWQYVPGKFVIGGKRINLAAFWFTAQNPGWTGTLNELTPVPATDLEARGVPGKDGAGFDGFTQDDDTRYAQPMKTNADGDSVPVGDPVRLPDGPQGPEGPVGVALRYRGTWNASTNIPALHDGTGTAGDTWLATVEGTANLGSGSLEFASGDYAVYNGTIWQFVAAAVIQGSGQVITHGSNADYVRPSDNSSAVIWAGTVPPENALEGDIWLDYSGSSPAISTTVLDDLHKGIPVAQTLVSAGTEPITWTVTAGAEPAGLQVTSAGVLSGTPTATGAYDFTVTATNGYGTDTQHFTGTVLAAVAPVITTTALGGTPQAGTPYSQVIVATGSVPMTWAVEVGSLPTGLNLDEDSGVISGTPTVSGAYSFTIRATNAAGYDDQAFSGSIAGAPPNITTTSLNPLSQGAAFSQTPVHTGTAPIDWTVSAGTLPTGLSQDPSTGQIYGTPSSSGAYDFTVQAENAFGSDTQQYTGTIAAGTPVIGTSSLGTLYRAVAFSLTPSVTGATPITWSKPTGSLPSGLSLNTSTGEISGTPSAAGSYSFTLRATNGYGSVDQAFSGSVLESTPSITESSLDSITTSVAFSQTLHASGYPTITWSNPSGSLPAGLTFDSATATISGTPTTPGAYSFTIRVTNSIGHTDTVYSGTVNPPIAFDAIGGGSATSASFTSSGMTHSITAAANTTVLLFVGWISPSSSSGTVTATCGGASMTMVGSPVDYGSSGANHVFGALFKYTNSTSGTKTVGVSVSGITWVAQCNSISYTGVGTVGALQTANPAGTTSASQTVTSAAGHRICQGFLKAGVVGSGFSAYNQTSRYNPTGASPNRPMQIGEAAGAASVTFTATVASGTPNNVLGMAVDLAA